LGARRADEFSARIQGKIDYSRRQIEVLERDSRIVPRFIAYFEEVFLIGGLNSNYVLPGDHDSNIGRSDYSPVSYAQYITFGTFGDSGKSLSGFTERLAQELAGNDKERLNS
jgi:hypothetical protein